jgi:hypothetical protein
MQKLFASDDYFTWRRLLTRDSLAIKPFLRADSGAKRLPERKPVSMTIAMGAYCAGGIVLCADTTIIAGDQKWQELKMSHVMGKSGSFAIANSSQDVNAANTLIRNLMDTLRDTDIKIGINWNLL